MLTRKVKVVAKNLLVSFVLPLLVAALAIVSGVVVIGFNAVCAIISCCSALVLIVSLWEHTAFYCNLDVMLLDADGKTRLDKLENFNPRPHLEDYMANFEALSIQAADNTYTVSRENLELFIRRNVLLEETEESLEKISD